MVDMNIVRKLEMDGMEYKNAFNIANLMEREGMSMEEARDKVLADLEKTNLPPETETPAKDAKKGKK